VRFDVIGSPNFRQRCGLFNGSEPKAPGLRFE
jgi:hypothetical protein